MSSFWALMGVGMAMVTRDAVFTPVWRFRSVFATRDYMKE